MLPRCPARISSTHHHTNQAALEDERSVDTTYIPFAPGLPDPTCYSNIESLLSLSLPRTKHPMFVVCIPSSLVSCARVTSLHWSRFSRLLLSLPLAIESELDERKTTK